MENLRPDVDGHTQAVVETYKQYANTHNVKWVQPESDDRTASRKERLHVLDTEKIVDDEWSDFEPYVSAWLKGPSKDQIINDN